MAVKYEGKPFKQISLEDMADFIEKNVPEDKEWFKSVAYVEYEIMKKKKPTGKMGLKYNHLKAVKAFCERYNPELIPVAKEPKKEPKTTRIANW